MAHDLIHDRGRGPEIKGTRLTVYNLLPHFIDPSVSEEDVCRMYNLSPQQVAAARAYVLSHADEVLAEHMRIEERLAAGNPPQVIEQAKQTREKLLSYKRWLAERELAESQHCSNQAMPRSQGVAFPTFDQWLAEHAPQSG